MGRTWSIPVPSESQSRTPVWSGRMNWQRQVREILNAPEGINACRHNHVDPQRVFAVAVTMARSADHRTGRRVTASRELLARRSGVSLTVLKRARRALSSLGMAREMVRGRLLRTVERWAAEAHHGRRQTKATSVWALISPKSAVALHADHRCRTIGAQRGRSLDHPQSPDHGPQSLSTSFRSCTSVRKCKTTRARTRAVSRHASAEREARPIALQRAAGELLRHAPALNDPRHIGAVCEAIRGRSIDVDRWSGRDIARALSEDTKRRGWTWPTTGALKNPIAFLRWRLSHVDWSGPSYTEQAQAAKRRRDLERAQAAEAAMARRASVASVGTRLHAMATIRRVLRERSTS